MYPILHEMVYSHHVFKSLGLSGIISSLLSMSSSVYPSVSYSLTQKPYFLLSNKCYSLTPGDNSCILESKVRLGIILIGLFPAVKVFCVTLPNKLDFFEN
jgi:hypothetical protein